MMGNANGKTAVQLDGEIIDFLAEREKREAKATSPRISSQPEYERREIADAHRRLIELRRAPLVDRKEAQAEFLAALRSDPRLVAERIGWLLGGSYGYGSMLLAKRVLESPRMNCAAALTQLVGALEWMAPEDMARTAWKTLNADERAVLERAVQEAIRDAESEQ